MTKTTNYLLLLLLLCVSSVLCAQSPSLKIKQTVSEEFELPMAVSAKVRQSLSNDDTDYFLVRHIDPSFRVGFSMKPGADPRKYVMTLYAVGKDVNDVSSEQLEMKYGKKEVDIIQIRVLNDRLYTIGTYFDKSERTHYTFAQELDGKTLKPIGSLQQIASYEDVEARKFLFFSMRGSENMQQLIVQYYYLPKNPKENDAKLYYYKTDLTDPKVINPPLPAITDGELWINSVFLTNEGQIISSITHEVKRDARSKTTKEMNIFLYKADGTEDTKVYTYDKVALSQLLLQYNNAQNTLVMAGIAHYEDGGSNSSKIHVYYLDLNSLAIRQSSEIPLSVQDRKFGWIYQPDETSESLPKETETLKFQNAIFTDDGEVVLVLAGDVTKSQRVENDRIFYYRSIYNKENLIVTHLKADGSPKYLTTIPARSIYYDPQSGYMGEYYCDLIFGQATIVFLDHVNNVNQFRRKPQHTAGNKMVYRVVTFDDEGAPRDIFRMDPLDKNRLPAIGTTVSNETSNSIRFLVKHKKKSNTIHQLQFTERTR